MRDDDFKTYYEEQRELLREAFAEIGQKAELLLTVGQLLMENGADCSRYETGCCIHGNPHREISSSHNVHDFNAQHK